VPTEYDIENLNARTKAGRVPRYRGPYLARIGDAVLNFREVRIEDPVPTGRQILLAADAHPVEEHMVFQILRNRELEELRLNETTDLPPAKPKSFLVFKGATSFRFELDNRVLEWGAPRITGHVLKYLARVDPQTHRVWIERRGREDLPIEDDDEVKLDDKGLERFFTGIAQSTEGAADG